MSTYVPESIRGQGAAALLSQVSPSGVQVEAGQQKHIRAFPAGCHGLPGEGRPEGSDLLLVHQEIPAGASQRALQGPSHR